MSFTKTNVVSIPKITVGTQSAEFVRLIQIFDTDDDGNEYLIREQRVTLWGDDKASLIAVLVKSEQDATKKVQDIKEERAQVEVAEAVLADVAVTP